MSELASRPVVVGVDGSDGGVAAAALAAIEAKSHRRPLQLVAACGPDGVLRMADGTRLAGGWHGPHGWSDRLTQRL